MCQVCRAAAGAHGKHIRSQSAFIADVYKKSERQREREKERNTTWSGGKGGSFTSEGKMHLQDSLEDLTSPHLFSFMENQSGLRRERVQVCRHRTHDIYTHMHTHVHISTQ